MRRRRIALALRRFARLYGLRVLVGAAAAATLAAMGLTSDGRPSFAVPELDVSPIATTPGCRNVSGAPRPASARRAVAPPRRRIPFFASRPGTLPPSGTPVVAGVRLPRGSRCGPLWSSDAGVPDAFALARRLAAAFPSTGLWPVIWDAPDEPDGYVVGGGGDVARAGTLDAGTVLQESWNVNGFGARGPFRGLADGAGDERLNVRPFDDAVERALTYPAPPGGRILILLPVNRPADVHSVLGMHTTEYFSDDALTAVLRSWEERFGAVVVALSAGGAELAVGAPPRDDDQARRLAGEHAALMPDWVPDELEALPRQLRSSHQQRGITSASYWSFGWPD